MFLFFFFFFFQAEDGIRDDLVTGVQTCALPISCMKRRSAIESTILPISILRETKWTGRSEERREGKSVDLGGRRIIKKKKHQGRLLTVHDDDLTLLRLFRLQARSGR